MAYDAKERLLMKAVYYTDFGKKPELGILPDPTPTPDGVVIEVKATGVYRSDWAWLDGT